MQKLKLVFFICLFAFQGIYGQWSVGFQAVPLVVNGSRLTGNFENITVNKTASDYVGTLQILNLGLTSTYSFDKSYAIRTELNYKMQGYRDINVFETFALNYVELPILFRYTVGDRTKFMLHVGPSVKFLTRATHYYRTDADKYESNVYGIYKPLVLVGNIGFGVVHRLSERISLSAETRFGYDLTQTVKAKDRVVLKSGDSWSFRNSHLLQMAITVGISYHFGQKMQTEN